MLAARRGLEAGERGTSGEAGPGKAGRKPQFWESLGAWPLWNPLEEARVPTRMAAGQVGSHGAPTAQLLGDKGVPSQGTDIPLTGGQPDLTT